MTKRIVFITGGARSGKSRFVLKEASGVSGKKAFIATAQALDDEMKRRIERHKLERGDGWDEYEEPLKIVDVIRNIEGKYSMIVIDCLTLWLSNLMHAGMDIEDEIESFISSLITCPHSGGLAEESHSSLFIVSNEVGMGIVPENELARRFRDMAGALNQKVAEAADEVYIVVAGIPVKIK